MPQEQKQDKKAPRFVHSKGWLRDLMVIHRQEGPGGMTPVFVQLNNFACHIPREVECEVAKPIVQTLREAIATQTFRDENNVEYSKDVKRFNFNIIKKNVNWDEIMANPDSTEFVSMNESYLKAIGEWKDRAEDK